MTITRTAALAGSTLLITATQSQVAKSAELSQTQDTRTSVLNQSSLKAIESSWLRMPPLCKARVFNADPLPLPAESMTADVFAFYVHETA